MYLFVSWRSILQCALIMNAAHKLDDASRVGIKWRLDGQSDDHVTDR